MVTQQQHGVVREVTGLEEGGAELGSRMGVGVAPGVRGGGRLAGMDAEQVARGLGWLSIGLGAMQVLAPRAMARLIGLSDGSGLVQLMGLREIGHGVAILAARDPAPGVMSRVGGDALDLSLLGAAMVAGGDEVDHGRLAGAAAAVLGVTALDVACAQQLMSHRESAGEGRGAGAMLTGRKGKKSGALHVRSSVTINRPIGEVYDFWRNLENLPRFMAHLESVTVLDERRSHWVVGAPAVGRLEWEAEITEERPGELLSWRSVAGSDVDNAGVVRFRPGPDRGRGERATVVDVDIRYSPPGGALGRTVGWTAAKVFGEAPEQQVADDLRRLKQVLETGEVVSAESPRGRCIG